MSSHDIDELSDINSSNSTTIAFSKTGMALIDKENGKAIAQYPTIKEEEQSKFAEVMTYLMTRNDGYGLESFKLEDGKITLTL